VLIADDTLIALEGLHRLLANVQDIEVIATTGSIAEAIRLTREIRPDVVLMDLKWVGDESAGVSAIQYLRNQGLETKIIAMTVYDHLIPPARAAGADAAITKDFAAVELYDLIREVYAAEPTATFTTAQVAEEALADPVTERERKILALIAKGLTDREIADKLGVSVQTTKNHVTNILRKLGASNRTQAVVIALRKRILDV